MHTGGDEIVTRALGRCLDHHGGFDLHEAVFVEILARYACKVVAHFDVLLEGVHFMIVRNCTR